MSALSGTKFVILGNLRFRRAICQDDFSLLRDYRRAFNSLLREDMVRRCRNYSGDGKVLYKITDDGEDYFDSLL